MCQHYWSFSQVFLQVGLLLTWKCVKTSFRFRKSTPMVCFLYTRLFIIGSLSCYTVCSVLQVCLHCSSVTGEDDHIHHGLLAWFWWLVSLIHAWNVVLQIGQDTAAGKGLTHLALLFTCDALRSKEDALLFVMLGEPGQSSWEMPSGYHCNPSAGHQSSVHSRPLVNACLIFQPRGQPISAVTVSASCECLVCVPGWTPRVSIWVLDLLAAEVEAIVGIQSRSPKRTFLAAKKSIVLSQNYVEIAPPLGIR